jgi:hypothetical protein
MQSGQQRRPNHLQFAISDYRSETDVLDGLIGPDDMAWRPSLGQCLGSKIRCADFTFSSRDVIQDLKCVPRPDQPRPIDLHIGQNLLHVSSCLAERDLFNPVEGIYFRVAGISKGVNPLVHARATGIVGGECHYVGTVKLINEIAQMCSTEHDIVTCIVGELFPSVTDFVRPGNGTRSSGH